MSAVLAPVDHAAPPAVEHPAAAALRAALQRQRTAYLADPVPTLAQRRADLRTLERYVHEQQEALIEAVRVDYGHRSRHETLMTEIGPLLASIRHARRHLRGWMKPQRRHVDRLTYGLGRNTVIPQPLGVVGVIVPWNFPINLSLIPLVYIYAAGNRAMVKMSENSRHLARLLIDTLPAYFPPEKLQVFDETGGVGIEFSKLPFDHLLFTGSGTTGRAVMAAAAQNLCPVTLELGGKAPAIVCDDVDIALAAERISFIKCLNAGQICTTVDHAYVPEAKVEAFVEAAKRAVPQRYADLDSSDYTSIIDRRAYERLLRALDEAQSRGATLIPLLPGRTRDDERRRLAPHLVLGAPADCALMQREIFGPILPIVPYRDLDEVIAALGDFRPHIVHSYGSFLEALFARVEATGAPFHRPALVTYSSDGMSESARARIAGGFGVPVFCTYQAIEMFKIGFECEAHDGVHVNIDLYPLRLDADGTVIVSNLVNRATVLLNYRLADVVAPIDARCPCGRTLPRITRPQGRSVEFLPAPDGGVVHPQAIRTIFTAERGVWQYQVDQIEPARFVVRVVAAADCDRAATARRIVEGFARWFGSGAAVDVRYVDALERTAGGKLRPIRAFSPAPPTP
jgi:coniferyl-aldehyde dehydrogenase